MISNPKSGQKLENYQKNLEGSVLQKVEKLDEVGFKKYLEENKK